MKYRKKPVVIEAVQYVWSEPKKTKEEAQDDIADFMDWNIKIVGDSIMIPTLEGEMQARLGDWIIKGVKGEFYPCKPDIFEMTYEALEAVEKYEARRRIDWALKTPTLALQEIRHLKAQRDAAIARIEVLEAKLATFLQFLDENYRHAFGDTARQKIRDLCAELTCCLGLPDAECANVPSDQCTGRGVKGKKDE